MAAKPISADEVATALTGLTGWSGDPTGIHRRVDAPGFLEGIQLVEAVAEAAEAVHHHPDIEIRHRRVTFSLRTHAVRAVTDADIELAHKIDSLVATLDRRVHSAASR